MTDRVPMIGKSFGLLTVLDETTLPGRRGRFFVCRCECGAERTIYGGHLRNGSTKGCGGACARRGVNATHRLSHSPEYRAWENARARCHNPANRKFPLYGGRGVSMCAAWRADFAAFYEEIGPRPSDAHSIDRIDNARGYEPGNVRWALATTQNRNRRSHRPKTMGVRRVTSG